VSTRGPMLSTPASDSRVPLHDFVAFSANVMDAHTVALFVEDRAEGCLRMIAGWSLSDNLIPEARVSIVDSDLGERYRSGQPTAEPYFEGDSSTLGMYSQLEPIRAYMTAPVGSRGLLWVDTRKAYRFTPKHLRVLADLATTAGDLLRLSARISKLSLDTAAAYVMQALLERSWDSCGGEDALLDSAVRLIVDRMGLDGALTAFRLPHRDLCQITACYGLPAFIQVGRVVRFKEGWVKRSLDNRKPAFVRAATDNEPDVVAFHARERFGFPLRSLAVIPWRVDERDRDDLLIAASAAPGRICQEARASHESVVALIRLIQTASLRKKLLTGVRRYDAESGVLSEAAFYLESREMLSCARAKGNAVALVLMEIASIERLYMEHAPRTVMRFLEMITDTMRLMQPRPVTAGKFKTGGFGLLVENAKEQEISALHKKAQYLFGTGYVSVEGQEIRYDTAMAVAHFPSECADVEGLWTLARARLALPSSTLYRWASLAPRPPAGTEVRADERDGPFTYADRT
jgi:hypothetical protein